MGVDDPRELDKIDQEIRINELKEKVREVTGEEMVIFESDDAPGEVMEDFWKNVLAYESAPLTCEAQELAKEGLVFPPAEELSDEELHGKLWELIEALARRNSFLYQTDHLSDRELYIHLTEQSLWEMNPEMPRGEEGWNCTIDILGGGSEEDIDLHHMYYADDEERAQWMEQFPDYKMPERKAKPYDRDRLLPVRREEMERRAWIEEMHAQGYTDEDIKRICDEEWEREKKEWEEKEGGEEVG